MRWLPCPTCHPLMEIKSTFEIPQTCGIIEVPCGVRDALEVSNRHLFCQGAQLFKPDDAINTFTGYFALANEDCIGKAGSGAHLLFAGSMTHRHTARRVFLCLIDVGTWQAMSETRRFTRAWQVMPLQIICCKLSPCLFLMKMN